MQNWLFLATLSFLFLLSPRSTRLFGFVAHEKQSQGALEPTYTRTETSKRRRSERQMLKIAPKSFTINGLPICWSVGCCCCCFLHSTHTYVHGYGVNRGRDRGRGREDFKTTTKEKKEISFLFMFFSAPIVKMLLNLTHGKPYIRGGVC